MRRAEEATAADGGARGGDRGGRTVVVASPYYSPFFYDPRYYDGWYEAAPGPDLVLRRHRLGQPPASPALARAQNRLPQATITRIRAFYPLNYDRNGPQAFPQSNMIVLVDTDAGITAIRSPMAIRPAPISDRRALPRGRRPA